MTHILIIGASDAGISAGLIIRECAPEINVTIAAKDTYPNFSICGLPFLIGGQVKHWQDLAHRKRPDLEATGIRFLLAHAAEAVDPEKKQVRLAGPEGPVLLDYDRLILGTGAESRMPPIEGLDAPGVFPMRFMGDVFAVEEFITSAKPRSALIIGAGYIGMEMAEALDHRGLEVTVAEAGLQIMPTLSPDLSTVLEKELEARSVRVMTRAKALGIDAGGHGLSVRFETGGPVAADMVLVLTGVRPAVDLARSAGILLGTAGAIAVDRRMATSLPHIFAAGDCAETWHRMLKKPVYLPLGTTAHKQGRVAGINAAGGAAEFAGSLGTQVVKIFDLVSGRTGLLEKEASDHGFAPLSVNISLPDHKAYYPSAHTIHIILTGDRHSGRLLGGQLLGRFGTEISKRIDVLAAAISADMTIAELSELDLSYTPPLSSPWDPLQMAASEWIRQVKRAQRA